MKIERFEVEGLAQYSYVVSDGGEAVVIDAVRDVERYLAYAAREDLKIVAVVETHIHADFAAGSCELVNRTGAELALSTYDKSERYVYAMPHRALRADDEVRVGKAVLRAMHTPGHTPEHLSFLLFEDGASEPSSMFSGDFLFVGSLGRPDLLGEDAKVELARAMYRSVQAAKELPEALAVYPGHGAGSFCGAGMSEAADTTLGVEKIANPFFSMAEEAFVAELLAVVPAMPAYYPRMKALNAAGAAALELEAGASAIAVERVAEMEEVTLLDVRSVAAFAEMHVPGSVGIAKGPSLALWAGWLLDTASPIVLVTDGGDDVEVRLALARVGLDAVLGHLEGGVEAWRAAGLPLAETDQVTEIGDAIALDVRNDAERSHRSIPGSLHVMLGDLPAAMCALAKEKTIVTVCESGLRASIAASLLQRAGFSDVKMLEGGMGAWNRPQSV
jgi:hydroxyacylglutathione hydrolase